MKALNSSGGYGILESKDERKDYFHRGLLWRRSGATLKRIVFKPEDQVPSWSWMAFDGEIRYMNVPFGDIEKAKDTVSLVEGIEPGTSSTGINFGRATELRAPVRTLAVEIPDWLIQDEADRILARPLKCVIVGKSIKETKDKQRTHYELIVSFLRVEQGLEIYERAGVAYLATGEIVPEQEKKYVRMR
jgi:hypothetical protein